MRSKDGIEKAIEEIFAFMESLIITIVIFVVVLTIVAIVGD